MSEMFFAMNLSESDRNSLQSLTLDVNGTEVKAIETRTKLLKKCEGDSKSTKADIKSAKALVKNAKDNADAVSFKAYKKKTEELAKSLKLSVGFVRMNYPLYSSAHITIGKKSAVENDRFIPLDEICNTDKFSDMVDQIFAMVNDRVEKTLEEKELPTKNTVKKALLNLILEVNPKFTGAVACGMDIDQLEMPLKETVKCEPWMLKEIKQEKFEAQLVRVLYRIVNKMDYERQQPKEQN